MTGVVKKVIQILDCSHFDIQAESVFFPLTFSFYARFWIWSCSFVKGNVATYYMESQFWLFSWCWEKNRLGDWVWNKKSSKVNWENSTTADDCQQLRTILTSPSRFNFHLATEWKIPLEQDSFHLRLHNIFLSLESISLTGFWYIIGVITFRSNVLLEVLILSRICACENHLASCPAISTR